MCSGSVSQEEVNIILILFFNPSYKKKNKKKHPNKQNKGVLYQWMCWLLTFLTVSVKWFCFSNGDFASESTYAT